MITEKIIFYREMPILWQFHHYNHGKDGKSALLEKFTLKDESFKSSSFPIFAMVVDMVCMRKGILKVTTGVVENNFFGHHTRHQIAHRN